MEKLFGRSYESIGNGKSDLILKTRGQIKIKWGEKYIDLIKDGKIVSEGLAIKKVVSDIPTKKGIYITEDGNIYLSDGSKVYNIANISDSNYVSYYEQENIKDSQKEYAQKNIGILYDSIEDLLNSNTKNGIAFISNSGKVYTIKNGVSQELVFQLPNPITTPLDIQVNDIAINITKGGIIKIGDLLISSDSMQYTGTDTFSVRFNNKTAYELRQNEVLFKLPINSNTIYTSSISSSSNPTYPGSFSIEQDGSDYVLKIDRIELTKGISPMELTYDELIYLIDTKSLVQNTSYIITDFQNEWELEIYPTSEDIPAQMNGYPLYVDENGNQVYDPVEVQYYPGILTPVIEKYKTVRPLVVTAIAPDQISSNVIMVDNPLYTVEYDITYSDIIKTIPATEDLQDSPYYNEETGNIELKAKGRIIKLTDQNNNSCNYDFKHLRYWYNNSWHYTFDNNGVDISDQVTNCVIYNQNYEIAGEIDTGQYTEDGDPIKSLLIIRDGATVIVTGNSYNIQALELDSSNIFGVINNTTFHGKFSGLTISSDDFPILSIQEKVKDVYYNEDRVRVICIPDEISPKGTIVAFYGTEIPYGWALCDGTQGTPNLIDRFIKGGTSNGVTGGSSEITIGVSNLPPHTHTCSSIEHNHTISFSEGNMGLEDENGSGRFIQQRIGYTDTISHSHTIGETGDGEQINIEPPYYTLMYIMKIT